MTKVPVNIKLPPATLARIQAYIEKHAPRIRDRTHLIELALAEYMKKPPK